MLPLVPPNPDAHGHFGRALRDDANGALLAEYRRGFEAALYGAKRVLHHPLSSAEFETHRAVENATTTALTVITTLWQAMHP